MKGKKQTLAYALYKSQLTNVFNVLRGPRLIVFTYHRIREDKETEILFDDGVYGPTASQFEDQMRWLNEYTKIITEDEAVDIIKNHRYPSKPCSLITFDDAYIDNYTLAFPILQRLNVPAIFFVATKLINDCQLGWWDIIAYLIKKSNKTTIAHGSEYFFLDKSRQAAIRYFQRCVKTGQANNPENLLTWLSNACDVPLPSTELQCKELMSWAQIKEVSQNKVAIGSHTNSHRILSTLSVEEQEHELSISKSILESKLGHEIRSISYPVGNYMCFTKDTQIIAEKCGYLVGFSFEPGENYNSHILPFSVNRFGAPQTGREMLSAITVFPKFFT